MYWENFGISLVFYVAMFCLKVASEQVARVLSQVKISGPVKYVTGETSELQLLISQDLSPKINTID